MAGGLGTGRREQNPFSAFGNGLGGLLGPFNPMAAWAESQRIQQQLKSSRASAGSPARAPARTPAPGAPGAGGAAYVSPYQGRADAVRGAIRSGTWFGSPLSGGSGQAAPGRGASAPNSTPVGYGAPPVLGTPAARTQRERMVEALGNAGVQQPVPAAENLKPYWAQNPEIAKAAAEGPKSTEVGYSDRADIQEWMNAMNKTDSGRDMVNRFLDQQRKRGLIREEPNDAYSPVFTQQQLADVDAVQSPAFSKGRDQILGMKGALYDAPPVDDRWSGGFGQGEPVDWAAASNASMVLPGSPAAKRREDLDRVLAMPNSMVEAPPSVNSRWAAGYAQEQPVDWNSAAGAKLNIPSVSGTALQSPQSPVASTPTGSVDWGVAANAQLNGVEPVMGNSFEMGRRFNDPDEQRRVATGFLGERIQGLQRYLRGGQ